MIRGIAVLAVAGLLSACAHDPQAERRLHAAVKPCCADLASLPTTPYAVSQSVEVSTSTPHHDFGNGLAPFIHIRMPKEPAPRSIEVRAFSKPGMYTKADPMPFPKLRVFLIDSAGNLAESRLGEGLLGDHSRWGVEGTSIRQATSIPPGTVAVIVATDPRGPEWPAMVTHQIQGQMMPAGPIFIDLPSRTVQQSVNYTIYGKFAVQFR